jgi:uncharacterized protein (TIGR03435 family)
MAFKSAILLAMIFFIGGPSPEERAGPNVGEPAPPITLGKWLQVPAGTTPSWEALKGKVVVLEFWATWCGPCVGQIPHLNAVAEAFQGKPVQFISVTDEEQQRVERFLLSKPIAGWVGLDQDRSMHKAYGISGIPETILIDSNGLVVALTDPDQVTEAVIEDMIAGKRPKLRLAAALGGMPEIRREGPASGQSVLLDVLIRPSSSTGTMSYRPGRLEMRGMTLRLAVSNAFEFPSLRISAPAWFDEATYDFLISVPRGSEGLLHPLFCQLLEDTFRFGVRRETKETAVLILKTAEGHKLGLRPPTGPGCSMSASASKITAVHCSLSDLRGNLEGALNLPVIDETGLKEEYDYDISWIPEDAQSLKTGLVEQLGLDLVPARRPVEMLIIEGAGKKALK